MIIKCPSCGSQNRIPFARVADHPRCGQCKTVLDATGNPYPVSSAAEFGELVTKSPLPVLVDFWAAWCGPCKVVAPELAKLARERKGSLLVAKLDTEQVPKLLRVSAFRVSPRSSCFATDTKRRGSAERCPQRSLLAHSALLETGDTRA